MKKYEVSDKDAEMEFENIAGDLDDSLSGVKCSPKAYRAGIRMLKEHIDEIRARNDYFKFFAGEAEESCPDWANISKPGGVVGPLVHDVLAVALEHRYHWSS